MKEQLLFILVLSVFAAMPTQAERLFKIVDDQGNVTYQSAPPSGNDSGDESIEQRDIYGGEDPVDARIAMDRAILEWPVTIYSTEQCKTCEVIRKQLQKRKIPYTEKFPARDAVDYNELQKVSGGTSIPVIVVGENVITVYSYLVLKQALNDAGYPKIGALEEEDES